MSLPHTTRPRKRKYAGEENETIPATMAIPTVFDQPSQRGGQIGQYSHPATRRQPEQDMRRNLMQRQMSRLPVSQVFDTPTSFNNNEAAILNVWRQEWDTSSRNLIPSRPIALLRDRAPINLTTHEQTAKSVLLAHEDYTHEPTGRLMQRLRAEEEEKLRFEQYQVTPSEHLTWQEKREYGRMNVRRRANEVGAIDLTADDHGKDDVRDTAPRREEQEHWNAPERYYNQEISGSSSFSQNSYAPNPSAACLSLPPHQNSSRPSGIHESQLYAPTVLNNQRTGDMIHGERGAW